ncbi:MAG: hypothetical protein AMXMBFR13_20240 [Phycisphaerae bacterium]
MRLRSCNHQRAQTAQQTGFTLIEVLVVVAIIALLVAILMPSLARVRAQARSTQCLSNARQSGQAMQTFALANKELVPRGGNHNTVHWTMVVARELGYIKAFPKHPTNPSELSVNMLRVDKYGVFHCPERLPSLPTPFMDYVVNSMNPVAYLRDNKSWGAAQLIHDYKEDLPYCKVSTYKRPSEVIYVLDAEREDKNTESGGNPSLSRAREQWKQGHEQQNPAIWSNGGIDCMDVWRGAHLPEGKNSINTTDAKGARRAARKMHLQRFTNANFFDGHGASVQLSNRPNQVANYAYWLKLFGVKDPLAVAQQDGNLVN